MLPYFRKPFQRRSHPTQETTPSPSKKKSPPPGRSPVHPAPRHSVSSPKTSILRKRPPSEIKLSASRKLALEMQKADVFSIYQSFGGKSSPNDDFRHTCTDKEGSRRAHFQEKDFLEGNSSPARLFGMTCRKGLKPLSPNQDSCSAYVLGGLDCEIYTVADGHGECGHDVSNLVCLYLPRLFLTYFLADKNSKDDPKTAAIDALYAAFANTQDILFAMTAPTWRAHKKVQQVASEVSGTTTSVSVYFRKTKLLVLAHVGDSSALIHPPPFDSSLICTTDHKPNQPAEKKRIEENGGCVVHDGYFNYRVYVKGKEFPGLNMSRALGDLIGCRYAGLSSVPDINAFEIEDEKATLVIASDGVWEFMSPEKVVRRVESAEDLQKGAESVARESRAAWLDRSETGMDAFVDDICCILVQL